MKNSICQSEFIKMKSLNNLFIMMSTKACNQRCRHCFIDFPEFKKIEDFISPERVKEALSDTKNERVECIYLNGGEPMMHPDFNLILRMCLKSADVCICTNGSYINEKKARFLKKVEGETSNELIFKISIDHWDERKNDEIRYHGAYRQAVFAIKHLAKYGFSPIISVTNYYREPENILRENFTSVMNSAGIDIGGDYIEINPYYDKNMKMPETPYHPNGKTDCEYGRALTQNGVYSCLFLTNDYRGRCGSSFKDYSDKSPLETACCNVCSSTSKMIFGIDFKNFQ